mmetsp:Transcript_12268/g.18684  ORF Transcript_12268/g.18684 Transcript_12268/m.18684 type:complete len:95 (+) Transcript_12268:55-339(+)
MLTTTLAVFLHFLLTEKFVFYTNFLTGSIPTQVGLLVELTRIDIASNELTGSIPTTFGLLTNMDFMRLTSNKLTGTIPSELGLLEKASTYFFSV